MVGTQKQYTSITCRLGRWQQQEHEEDTQKNLAHARTPSVIDPT